MNTYKERIVFLELSAISRQPHSEVPDFSRTTSHPKLDRLEKSRSQRIVWLLEELKVPYEVKTFDRVNQLAPEDLKKVHPLGKSPSVSIEVPGQSKPIVLVESAFITEYLISHFAPHLAPEKFAPGNEGKLGGETESWMRYEHLMHYNEGTLMPFMVMKLIAESKSSPLTIT